MGRLGGVIDQRSTLTSPHDPSQYWRGGNKSCAQDLANER